MEILDKYGHFSEDGKEFIINTPRTPRHWYNYFWNEEFVSFTSQSGQGLSFCQDDMGNRIDISFARMAFLLDNDSKTFWNVNGYAKEREYDSYQCRHGLGYTVIEAEKDNIKSSFRIFVPRKGCGELWTIKLKNNGSTKRFFKLIPFIDTIVDGPMCHQNFYMTQGYYDSRQESAVLKLPLKYNNTELYGYTYMTADQKITGYETRQSAFIGYGTWQQPDALERGELSSSESEMEKPILALSMNVELEAGEEKTINVSVGSVLSMDELGDVRKELCSGDGIENEFQGTKENILDEIAGITFTTPEKTLDHFTSLWLKRQITLGTLWARVRHNGYRDLTQDIGAMALWNPTEALPRFKRVLRKQYSNGYAPRTWLGGEIKDNGFADNHSWIPFTGYNLVMETGNIKILEEEAEFNDGSIASIYEHIKRAVEYLWEDRGPHGLCLIHSGDWNDCLNLVGPKGKGESVWLSMSFYRGNQQLRELAKLKGDNQTAQAAKKRAEKMYAILNNHGWDGKYYLRAYTDDGGTLGSHKNKQGTFFLNTQTWAVLAGVADKERSQQIMKKADELLDIDLGTTTVQNPFSYIQHNVGWMSYKKPGIQENGGVYLHACTFKLVADCLLGRRDKVEKNIMGILPFVKNKDYKSDGEPFVFCNCYFAIKDSYRYGTCGQSWGTGTAGWFFYALCNYVYGLQPEIKGLRVAPCLPPSWKKCCIKRAFRGAEYEVNYEQQGDDGKVETILVNGEKLSGAILPWQSGQKYKVDVILS